MVIYKVLEKRSVRFDILYSIIVVCLCTYLFFFSNLYSSEVIN